MQEVKRYPNGIFSWIDLATTDLAGAKAFYRGLFGWEPMDVPPNWAVYVMVEDAEATGARAKELGANLLTDVTTAGEMGRFVVIQDPQGAVLTAMAFHGPVDTPPGT